MRSRAFPLGVALLLSHGYLSFASAQQADKIPGVGVLSNSPLTSLHYQAFRQGLRDLGYIEGKTHRHRRQIGENGQSRSLLVIVDTSTRIFDHRRISLA
jgi:hypothetical protein